MSASMQIIEGRARDLGGFAVRRVLPAVGRRMVGPFIFLDEMGPATFAPGQGIDVRLHPHIALATVTYLFDGAIRHRDSLGTVQDIVPGDVNWMSAGRGIAHSERTAPEVRAAGHRPWGMQAWFALPKTHEETEPFFAHHPAAALPAWAEDGCRVTLIAGEGFGRTAPVAVPWPTLYADVVAEAGGRLLIGTEHRERAIYVAAGAVALDGAIVSAGQLSFCDGDRPITLVAAEDSRVMILDGAPMDGPRTIWWNFVSSDPARIERAKADWRDRRSEAFGQVPGEAEFIPLPDA